MAKIELLSENNVTEENLKLLFKRAFMSSSIDEDGDLIVETDSLQVVVSIKKDTKILQYMTYFRIKESSPLELKHAFINKINNDYIFVQFSIPEDRPDIIVANYYLLYEEGITTFQIGSSIRLFDKIVMVVINDCDDNDLIE